MRTVETYLMRQIAVGLLIATAVLMPLFSFLDLLDQLDDVGKGLYQAGDAFAYVALMLPRRFIQLAPFIALIGNVIALGRLAVNSELIAMRAAGLSPMRISRASLKVGLALLVLLAVLEQSLAPWAQQRALALRAQALEQSTKLGHELGIWTRDPEHFLRIGAVEHGRIASDVEIMRLDKNGLLAEYIYARSANIISAAQWKLMDVTDKIVHDGHFQVVSLSTMNWRPFLKPDQVSTLTRPPESLSPVDLFQYVHYLKSTGQQSEAYALALWQKLGGGLTTIAMVLLSVPFVLGSARTGFANRLVLAGVTGISVYLLDQILANAGLILELNPMLVALVPGLVLIGLARYWLLHCA